MVQRLIYDKLSTISVNRLGLMFRNTAERDFGGNRPNFCDKDGNYRWLQPDQSVCGEPLRPSFLATTETYRNGFRDFHTELERIYYETKVVHVEELSGVMDAFFPILQMVANWDQDDNLARLTKLIQHPLLNHFDEKWSRWIGLQLPLKYWNFAATLAQVDQPSVGGANNDASGRTKSRVQFLQNSFFIHLKHMVIGSTWIMLIAQGNVDGARAWHAASLTDVQSTSLYPSLFRTGLAMAVQLGFEPLVAWLEEILPQNDIAFDLKRCAQVYGWFRAAQKWEAPEASPRSLRVLCEHFMPNYFPVYLTAEGQLALRIYHEAVPNRRVTLPAPKSH
ncbi:hypothetical protein H4R33_001500 [Dimargaris cristalligena]|uniref:Uncharacterized protein n=1 Tax=Dimargaris cristalligena TaxID=215637 RepID=A0A4P9ZKR4_9FUNG|nr:hypothetical protein H4R33_001500 [Dimargaris cristalligena]RKP33876.1 hypothetical protein BJ085DRAFT_40572 [Dimargaris cristalligena]|eukprot:RKP33876.1 hypothetical protein BJ085DRAFT_40572 [Dimargaris cristalligena]